MAAQVQVQPQAVTTGVGAPAPGGAQQLVPTSLYVGDLERNVTDRQLYDLFNQLGQVVSSRVCRCWCCTRRSLGYGYVNYANPQDAARAMEVLNFTPLNGKAIRIRRQWIKTEYVYVKNLSESATDEELNKVFSKYGTVTSAVVMRDADGNSKCFGFVNFENAKDAAKAVNALNRKKFDNKEWYVGIAQKKHEREQELKQRSVQRYMSKISKICLNQQQMRRNLSEREQELKQRFVQTMKEAVDKSQGLNLYIKNLDDTIDDENLKELFAPFGTITSFKRLCGILMEQAKDQVLLHFRLLRNKLLEHFLR